LGLVLGLAIAGLPVTGILLVAGAAAIVVISFAEPLLGIGVALLVGPLRAWLEITRPGFAPHAGQMVLALSLGAWIVRGLLCRDLRLRLPPLLLPLVGFLFVGLVSLWDPVDLWTGTLEFVKWLQVLLVAMMVLDGVLRVGDGRIVIRPERENRWGQRSSLESSPTASGDPRANRRVLIVVAILAAAGLSQALIGVWQFGLRGDGVEAFAINERFYRAYGTFQQPNPYAGLLGLVGAVLVGLAAGTFVDSRQLGACRRCAGRRAWMQLAAIAVPAGLIVTGLVASWSRGGWMGFGAAMMVLVVLLPRRGWWGLLMVVAVVAVGVGLTTSGLLPASIVGRMTGFLSYIRFEDVRGAGINDESFSVVERMAHWQAALSMWRSRFWRGVGLGCYEAAYDAHRLINWPLALGHAHNFYLNLLAEVGTLGLLVYLVWLGAQFVVLTVASRRLRGWERGLAIGLAAAWTHLAVHSLVDNLLVNNVQMHVGVLVGLTAWIGGRGGAVGHRPQQRVSLLPPPPWVERGLGGEVVPPPNIIPIRAVDQHRTHDLGPRIRPDAQDVLP